jgi:hypothetical protein
VIAGLKAMNSPLTRFFSAKASDGVQPSLAASAARRR